MTGTAFVQSDLSVEGTTYLNSLQTSGSTIVGASFTVTGSSQLNYVTINALTIADSLIVSGDTSLNSLYVTGNIVVNGSDITSSLGTIHARHQKVLSVSITGNDASFFGTCTLTENYTATTNYVLLLWGLYYGLTPDNDTTYTAQETS